MTSVLLVTIGAGPPTLLAFLVLGVCAALLWSHEHPPLTVPEGAAARLLHWAVALLPPERIEWGQAMVGELDRIEGGAKRWRFSLGCSASVVLQPPRDAMAPLAACVALALGGAVVFGIGFVHFGFATNPWNWIMLVIIGAIVIACVGAVSVQLRRPGVALLGLTSGLLVAGAWCAFSHGTYTGLISPINSAGSWYAPALYIAVPMVVGVVSAWQSGSASTGRRAARLAGFSAGLAMFFLSSIAVVAIDGGPRDPGSSVSRGVSEAFSNVALLYLITLPVATATIGWVAATATARLQGRAVLGASVSPSGASTATGDGTGGRTTGQPILRVAAVVVVLLLITRAIEAR